MNTVDLIVLSCVAGGVIVVALLVGRVLRELRARDRQDPAAALLMLQSQLEALREQVRQSLEGGRLEIDRRLEHTQQMMGEVRRGLVDVDRQVRTVSDATRDLRELQELLRSPTVRGGMGEQLLGELLVQVLPRGNFELQHEFAGRERVDAVLKIGDGLVPVDAKFPLENFRRLRNATRLADAAEEQAARRDFRNDVRRHVDDIAKRYIRPGEGTFDFAMMYIPAEGVYQEVIDQPDDDGLDLMQFALSRRVVPVSPQSFYAYLQVIVLGMRGLTIERRAREIMDRLGSIRRRLSLFTDSFEIAARHLGNAQRQMDQAARRLSRLGGELAALSGEGPAVADDDGEGADVSGEEGIPASAARESTTGVDAGSGPPSAGGS